jgi:hypothetical protein
MNKGYGTTMVDYKNYLTHRAAWFVEYGVWPIPNALHECDNKKCCDVAHLFEGTNKDNIDDYIAKGLSFGASSDLTLAEVLEIRQLAQAKVFPQRDIAEIYGTSVPTVSSIKNGYTPKKLLQVFHTSLIPTVSRESGS